MTELRCTCGQIRITLAGPPIVAVECCCTSCRSAGARLQDLPGAPHLLGPYGETSFVLVRKDRVTLPPAAQMQEFRLTSQSGTRRVVAACCNTPLFAEFQSGHWLSLYSLLWPAGSAPKPELRTMTKDLPDPSVLSDDIPNLRGQNFPFMWRLLKAWVAMGFRSPKIAVAGKVET